MVSPPTVPPNKASTNRYQRAFAIGLLFSLPYLLSGCAGIARGVTEGIIATQNSQQQHQHCYIKGRSFGGLESFMHRQEALAGQKTDDHPILKILVVHGIGSHRPGYATRLAENVARSLKLNRTSETAKEIRLEHPQYPDQGLGVIRFNRYLDNTGRREMLLAELTWDPIVEQEKQSLAFDSSGEYSFRRALANNALKEFVNATLPDVLMYNGASRAPILMSIGQSLCWLMNETWQSLPTSGAHVCNDNGSRSLTRLHDDYVFITHSLGSRITVDALQWIAGKVSELAQHDPWFASKKVELQDKEFTVIMLSNQLPLLQLGQPPPQISQKIDKICHSGAGTQQERLFKKTHLLAFSDPNDLFSYAIPKEFIDNSIDSRLCPTLTNVILNIAEVQSILGNQFANPLTAHTDYDNDARVIGIISQGLHSATLQSSAAGQCTWLETVPDTQPSVK